MNDCSKHLDKCKARCCKYVGFSFHKGILTKESKEYYEMHEGIVVLEREKLDLILVKTRCKNLNEDLTCKSYDKRPHICVEGYNQIKKGVTFMPGCAYPPGKESVVMTEEEVEAAENGK